VQTVWTRLTSCSFAVDGPILSGTQYNIHALVIHSLNLYCDDDMTE
jgi:hypothetical protein